MKVNEKPQLVQLTENISYLPATHKPFSCDVVFIKTADATWIFDVGCSKTAAKTINEITGTKNIVLSHFHPDHCLNLLRVSYTNLYVSKYTKKYTLKGTVINNDTHFNTKPEISVILLPSSHTKGCLCLLCGDYAFMGDGTYAKERKGNHTYNAQILQEEIAILERISSKYVCLSHDPQFVQERVDLIALHKQIYARKSPNNPIISVEDFFNKDGSVKRDYSIESEFSKTDVSCTNEN
ncbi:MAG: MBL fold metallo-hydrolase [Treponemataceae bacterium]|nr:MBL fold metallo-hydrolase [Treponemataceae bacterium]